MIDLHMNWFQENHLTKHLQYIIAMSTAAPIVAFKKAPRRPVTTRKRSTSPSASANAEASSSVVRPTKKSLINPLIQGTKRRRLDGDDDLTGGGLDELDYRADDNLLDKGDTYATRASDWDLESAPLPSARAVTAAVRLNEDGDIDDGMYRGLNGYLPTINKTREQTDSKMKTAPIRATANIRTITLVDYQPDVCKDYKETGFCGYGDSCKFMHDRGDYLAGWQLDKLDMGAGAGGPVEDEEEEVPFACLICRKPFTEPVVTKCGHYFCMK
jgi:RING finger protein 113A